VQVYRKSVFLVFLAPARLNLVTAGLEYLPKFPVPRAAPRFRARYFDPRFRELGLRFLFWLTFCSVCFLQVGQKRFMVLGIFMLAFWGRAPFINF